MIKEPLSLSHREILEPRFRSLDLMLAEYSFANLYLFRQLHHYQVILLDDEIFIEGVTRNGIPYIMLTSNPRNLSFDILKSVCTDTHLLFPIPDDWISALAPITSKKSFNEAESDYLFRSTKLAFFPGRHLSGKRNLVKQLHNAHQVKSEALNHQFDDARAILDSWQRELLNPPEKTDYSSCQEAIQQFHALGLHGRIIYIDQQPAAFAIGEWIKKDCYAIHFTKASRTIKGLYQYLYQDLAQTIEKSCTWINLEQDLGLDSLRRTKHSYLPDHLLRKWRISS